MEIISTYTSNQAEDDGFLFDITKLNPDWKKGIFNYVTTNLMNQGYMEKDFPGVRIVNLLDLLNQANQIVRKASDNFKNFDSFFSGSIELPSGKQQKIFIGQNETGKFTIMLPEDY
jgi:hypothetical protein